METLTFAMLDKCLEEAKLNSKLKPIDEWFANYRYIQERNPDLSHDEILDEMEC